MKKFQGSFLIANLLIAVFAFAFLFGSVDVVEGQAEAEAGGVLDFIEGKSDNLPSTLLDRAETDSNQIPGKTSFFKSKTGKTLGGVGASVGAGLAIRQFLGDEPWGVALGNAVAVGGSAYSLAANLIPTGEASKLAFIGNHAAVFGLGVGAVVFLLTYKKVEYETVFFTCQPWEAPIGGDDCEKCNDGIQPCSEYRCKSLGQACGIINAGTENEMCVWENRKDVNSPAIQPLESALTDGYVYVPLGARPPNWGTEIKPQGEDCIPPFTPIQFGIQTDKPSQCKIDFLIKEGGGQIEGTVPQRTIEPAGFDNMQYYFGESTLYDYNHTQVLSLPSPDTINRIGEINVNTTGGLEIKNDGNYNLYVRCRSANGYYNADPYSINFCVQSGPDLTPPIIEETSIRDGQPVNFEVDEIPLSVFTNEPANCRWARDNDLGFKDMKNEMVCANNLQDVKDNLLYECRTTLTGIQDRGNNLFYFRCEDQPWEAVANRNQMQIGKPFTIVGTEPLNIRDGSVIPETGTIKKGATSVVTIELGLETQNGYENGNANCLYSADNQTFIKFFETGTHLHRQNQDLTDGKYTYYYQCIDLGGNMAQTSTTFDVFIDKQAPRVVRVLNDGNRLKIITDEDAICRYSNDVKLQCNFDINKGDGTPLQYSQSDKKTEHLAVWNLENNYYIKCMDENGKQPNPTECSIIVRPVELAE